MPKQYRPNVAAILQNPEGRILLGERSNIEGAWQLPQGGVDEGETPVDALRRELEEEVGVRPDLYEIVERRGGYRYDYPRNHGKGKKYDGQEQTYFLCRFRGVDADVSVTRSGQHEFSRHRWIRPEEFDAAWVPDFKRDIYRRVFEDFFGVKI